MKVVLSWIKDFVDLSLPVDELAYRLTMAGLEVEEIRYVGLPMPVEKVSGPHAGGHSRHETKITGIEWDPDKIVTAQVLEVRPHPNADRLVLCQLDDGQQVHTVLTGAPNLYPYRGQGPLAQPLKVPYAKEGAHIYDGHQPGQVLTTLKRAKIRGVESYSMICSEKELGISEDHEGVIILDSDAPVGVPLRDYMGDAVLEVSLLPSIARAASMLGVAREAAAITGQSLRQPDYGPHAQGPSIAGRAALEIRNPELNPRFVLGLIEEVAIGPSPYWVQRRLRLAGMRPINNVVDATNYVMLEIGQPLHAFDYDVLVQRAGGPPTIITRTARLGERLTTLDGIERELDDYTVTVCDTAGALSIAGVMGGAESEVSENTRNILLEGAAWNFINVRRTAMAQHLMSEAAFRFSRGVHPAMAERGVLRGLELMRLWTGGAIAQGLVDDYPLPPLDPTVEVTPVDVRRWLGIDLTAQEIGLMLSRLEFMVEIQGERVRATTPDHRLDIGTGITGVADIIEEVARVYGYDRIPETRMADELPPQRGNPTLERSERIRDLLVGLGLQEVVTYRMTTPEREARLLHARSSDLDSTRIDLDLGSQLSAAQPYVRVVNPIAAERSVMRRSLLSSVLEVVERNARLRERLALFEIGPVYLNTKPADLPEEPGRLAILLTGPRALPAWQGADAGVMDFYDLKGIIEALFASLHLAGVRYTPGEHPSFHPGKCAQVLLDEQALGVLGELHPAVQAGYEAPGAPIQAAVFDLNTLIQAIRVSYPAEPVPAFPPVLEDLAVIVDETIPAGQVGETIRLAGGRILADLRLFDVYRSPALGAGKKSLAYRLTYQDPERTLTDREVAAIRQRILHRLEEQLKAKLRS